MYSGLGKLRTALAPGAFTDGSGPPDPRSNSAADLSDDQLTDAIAEADSIINAAIGAFYVTPVTTVDGATPHPIDYWSRSIAAYLATCTYRRSLDFTNDDPVYRRYLVAMGALADVKNGNGTLSIPPNVGDTAGSGAGAPINPYSGNLFSASDFNLSPQPANFGYGQNRDPYGPGYWWGNDG